MPSFTAPNIDRLIAAMKKEKLDRVPNFEDIIDPAVTAHIMGRKQGDRVASRALPPDEYIELARRTSQDAINIAMNSWAAKRGSIITYEDLENARNNPLNPDDYRRKIIPYIEATENTGIGVCANICAPFFISYMMTGPVPIQDFMLKLHDDVFFVEEIMEIQLQRQMRIVEAILDLPISFFIIADDTCGADGFFCSPELMDKIWAPRAERLVNLVKQKGLPIMWHCCGKLDQVIPYLVSWGIECVEPIQASCNDIYALKKQWGDRLCIKGNLNIEGVLAFGTPEEVAEDTRNLIDQLATDGGYIVASSHSIVDAIPPANYKAMIDTAVQYGRYFY